jgi:hypothetical protein
MKKYHFSNDILIAFNIYVKKPIFTWISYERVNGKKLVILKKTIFK